MKTISLLENGATPAIQLILKWPHMENLDARDKCPNSGQRSCHPHHITLEIWRSQDVSVTQFAKIQFGYSSDTLMKASHIWPGRAQLWTKCMWTQRLSPKHQKRKILARRHCSLSSTPH